MKTITIPVPQAVVSTADAFDDKEPFVLYKFDDSLVKAVTTKSTIKFTLQEDGSWKTADNYGFSTKSYVKQGLYYYYMNCFSGYDPDYPTMFVKKDASTQGNMSPARRMTKVSARRETVRPPLLPSAAIQR
jgi:hypothetical protein